MTPYLVLVADGARARLFTASLGTGGNAARLEEREALLSPERSMAGRDVFSNLKSGSNRAPGRGRGRSVVYSYDDHRSRHRDEVERRFARRVADAVGRMVRRESPSWFVVVAEPRLLGMLRAPLDAKLPQSLPRTELSGDLSWHALPHIRAVLERRGVLPKSQPSAEAWRPRGQPPPERARRVKPPRARKEPKQTARPRRGRAKVK